jgi:hypothetical protein
MTQESNQPWDWFGGEGLQLPTRLDQEDLGSYLAAVDERLHRLALVLEAMRELLEEAGLFRQDQLRARLEAIDLRDGVADGRLGAGPQHQRCGGCGRTLNSRLKRCLYCGSANLQPLD